MTVYVVLYQIASDMLGYHDMYLDKVTAIEESKRMNESEKGMYYQYFVKVKKLKEENE